MACGSRNQGAETHSRDASGSDGCQAASSWSDGARYLRRSPRASTGRDIRGGNSGRGLESHEPARIGDLQTLIESPGDVVVEGVAEVAQCLILGRSIAGDGGDLLDPVQKVSFATLGADLEGARVRLEAVALKVFGHGPPLPRAGEAHLSWPPHRRPCSPAMTCGGAPDRANHDGLGDGSVHGCRRRGRDCCYGRRRCPPRSSVALRFIRQLTLQRLDRLQIFGVRVVALELLASGVEPRIALRRQPLRYGCTDRARVCQELALIEGQEDIESVLPVAHGHGIPHAHLVLGIVQVHDDDAIELLEFVSVQSVHPGPPRTRPPRERRQALTSVPRTLWAWNAPRLRRSMSRDVRRSSLCSWSSRRRTLCSGARSLT